MKKRTSVSLPSASGSSERRSTVRRTRRDSTASSGVGVIDEEDEGEDDAEAETDEDYPVLKPTVELAGRKRRKTE